MLKEEWKNRIIKACQDAGTYEEYFADVIDTLSSIMETRDEAHRQYIESGSHPTIIHTNKAKERNSETFGNGNADGNAIYEVCKQWAEQKI